MEKIEERLKAQDLGLMFNIKCVGDDLKCSEDNIKQYYLLWYMGNNLSSGMLFNFGSTYNYLLSDELRN